MKDNLLMICSILHSYTLPTNLFWKKKKKTRFTYVYSLISRLSSSFVTKRRINKSEKNKLCIFNVIFYSFSKPLKHVNYSLIFAFLIIRRYATFNCHPFAIIFEILFLYLKMKTDFASPFYLFQLSNWKENL